MQVEEHANCESDALTIFEGPELDFSERGKFCGYKLPSSIESTSNSISVEFISDSTSNRRGFKISYSLLHLHLGNLRLEL